MLFSFFQNSRSLSEVHFFNSLVASPYNLSASLPLQTLNISGKLVYDSVENWKSKWQELEKKIRRKNSELFYKKISVKSYRKNPVRIKRKTKLCRKHLSNEKKNTRKIRSLKLKIRINKKTTSINITDEYHQRRLTQNARRNSQYQRLSLRSANNLQQ